MTGASNNRPEQRKSTCAWVLASGPHQELEIALKWAPEADWVIAADGGTVLARELGLRPDLIVGDIDSSPTSLVEQFEAEGTKVRRYDHDTKWETDTELAMLAALDFSPDTVVLLGALGGRLDHALANVLLLTRPAFVPLDIRILDDRHEAFLAKTGTWNPIRGNRGDTVTLLPVGGDATGVRTDGLHWPLAGETLPRGYGRGVSNRVDTADARLRLDEGLLLVVVEHQIV
jgi:thiamine pyrophosphokinase